MRVSRYLMRPYAHGLGPRGRHARPAPRARAPSLAAAYTPQGPTWCPPHWGAPYLRALLCSTSPGVCAAVLHIAARLRYCAPHRRASALLCSKSPRVRADVLHIAARLRCCAPYRRASAPLCSIPPRVSATGACRQRARPYFYPYVIRILYIAGEHERPASTASISRERACSLPSFPASFRVPASLARP
jgi:hypothetical protein